MKLSSLHLPFIFLTLTSLLALVRWAQSVQAIPGETIQFLSVHDINWDPENRTLTRTGTDPHAWFSLPPAVIPIRKVSFQFGGVFIENEGTFYIFQSAAVPNSSELGPVVTGQVKGTSDGFVVSGKLQDSKLLRLDLPDFLPRPLVMRRVVIETPFVNWSSWSFRLTLAFFGLTVASLVLAIPRRRAGAGELVLEPK